MVRSDKKVAAGKMKNASSRRDTQLRDFERHDLGAVVASAGTGVIVRSQRPTRGRGVRYCDAAAFGSHGEGML